MKSFTIKFLAIVAFLFTCFIGLAQIDRTKIPKPGPAPQIQLKAPTEFTLENGLTVMIVENKKLPRVSYQLRMDNVPASNGDKTGISGILGSLLGNGTTNIPKDAFNEEVDFLGANMSFGSSGGFVSGLSKYSDRLLELMADAVINPVFSEEEFAKEKDIAIQGFKTGEKSVETAASRVSNALVYGKNHPYGEFTTEETLNNITLDDVRAYYESQFAPSKAYLVILGDVDLSEIETHVKKYFSVWQAKASVTRSIPQVNPNPQYRQINFVDMPNAIQSNIIVTNNIDRKMGDADYHASLIANYILGGGGTGYLFRNLRDQHGYTYGSYSSIGQSRFGAAKFEATAEVRNEVTDSSVVEILNEIKRIRTEKVNPDVLKAAKAVYAGSFVQALEQPSTIANYALNIKLNKLPNDFYKNFLQKINAVTTDDILRVANKYFKADNIRIIVVGKGSDVLENLEKTKIPIMYFDKYANPVEKPVFAKPIPEGITAESVIKNYIKAIGGKEAAKMVNSVHSMANVTIEGVPLKLSADMKLMTPNKQSTEISAEGMGVLMKQKFNGETGYAEQQGMRQDLTADENSEKKKDYTIFPELYMNLENVSLESAMTLGDKEVYKLKVTKNGKEEFRYYDAESGLLVQSESTQEAQGQTVTSSTKYDKYADVNGVRFPFYYEITSGPQVIVMNVTTVKVNEGVSDQDFN